MKVGILGGTFDPIHNGHIAIAKAAGEQFGLDLVFVMPARIPPHKRNATVTADIHRAAMTVLALIDEPKLAINLIEFAREGASYTSETLALILRDHPDTELYYIIGQDSLRDFPKWHEPEQIASMAKLLTAIRDDNREEFMQLLAERNAEYNNAFLPIDTPYVPVSSTELRIQLENGTSSLVKPLVAQYAERFGLYSGHSTVLREETIRKFENICEELKARLSRHRYEHSLGVAYFAANYLQSNLELRGVEKSEDGFYDAVQKAFLAGILHDSAKNIPLDSFAQYCEERGIAVDETERQSPEVLHAKAGRYIAEHEFEITDIEILSAIEKHCLGDNEMNEIDLAVYAADFTEPFRDHIPALCSLGEIRRIALEDVAKASLIATQCVIKYLEDCGGTICNKTYETLHMLEQMEQNKNNLKKENNTNMAKENYTSLDLAKTAFQALENKKGFDVKVIEIDKVSTIADYFVIADGNNPSQVEAMVDEVQLQLHQQYDLEPKRVEGARNCGWILMDYGDIVVHVFSSQDRLFYDLERVWRDGISVETKDWTE